MSDTYSTAPPDQPEYAGDQADAQSAPDTKASQQEANYREGSPQRSCGLCGYFDSKGHSCDVVEGEISPFGYSDLYQRQDNPFREGETEAFEGGTPVASVTPEAAPPSGLLQIGRKSYGGEA